MIGVQVGWLSILIPNRPLFMEPGSDEEISIGSDFDSLVIYKVLLKMLTAFPSVTYSTTRVALG